MIPGPKLVVYLVGCLWLHPLKRALMFSAELERYQAKKDVARKVIAAENYMAATFWSYIKDADVYNYSYTQ